MNSSTTPIESLAERLYSRQAAENQPMLNAAGCRQILDRLLGLLFPHYSGRRSLLRKEYQNELSSLQSEMAYLLSPLEPELPQSAEQISSSFFSQLPAVFELMLLDAQAICDGDPAATSTNEVVAAYPGFKAISCYRLAHILYQLGVKVLPRIWTEYAHQLTGVDIHPGAKIGARFCIDHGTGIVIGETSEIADQVKLYQGVTLGALSVDKSMAQRKRHPTIEAGVVIYSNATILGGDTVIGAGSIIGGNVWLTESVPPHSTVYHRGEITVRTK